MADIRENFDLNANGRADVDREYSRLKVREIAAGTVGVKKSFCWPKVPSKTIPRRGRASNPPPVDGKKSFCLPPKPKPKRAPNKPRIPAATKPAAVYKKTGIKEERPTNETMKAAQIGEQYSKTTIGNFFTLSTKQHAKVKREEKPTYVKMESSPKLGIKQRPKIERQQEEGRKPQSTPTESCLCY